MRFSLFAILLSVTCVGGESGSKVEIPNITGSPPPFNMSDVGAAFAILEYGEEVLEISVPSMRNDTKRKSFSVVHFDMEEKVGDDGKPYHVAHPRNEQVTKVTTYFVENKLANVKVLCTKVTAWSQDGKEIASEDLATCFASPKPVVLLVDKLEHTPEFSFYSQILSPKIVFLYVEQSDE